MTNELEFRELNALESQILKRMITGDSDEKALTSQIEDARIAVADPDGVYALTSSAAEVAGSPWKTFTFQEIGSKPSHLFLDVVAGRIKVLTVMTPDGKPLGRMPDPRAILQLTIPRRGPE